MKGKMRILRIFVVSMLAGGPALLAAGSAVLGPSGQEKTQKNVSDKAQASDIGTVTIKLSGIGRQNKATVIRYRKSDFAIVAVTENGKDIPPDRWGEYKDQLTKALEYPRIRDLLIRIDEFKKSLTYESRLTSEQRLRFDKLLGDLNGFLAQASSANKTVLGPGFDKLRYVAFEKLARAMLIESRFLSPGGEVRLILKESGCALNGRELPLAMSHEILDLWERCFGTSLQSGERITYIFNPDRESEERPIEY